MKNLTAMLPFLEDEDLYQLSKQIINGEIDMNLSAVLPFMKEKTVDKIWEECCQNGNATLDGKNVILVSMLPFLSEKLTDEMFLSQVRAGKMEVAALPFVSDRCLHQLVVMYSENPELDLNIDAVYPFLNSEDISLLFRTYMKNNVKKQ